jgi:hypothetical protein
MHKKAAVPSIDLKKRINISGELIMLQSILKKKGIVNRSVTADTINEKSSAFNESNAFFSDTADNAEKTADINASKNQFILFYDYQLTAILK